MTTPTDTKNQDAAEEVSMKKFKRLILQMKLDQNYEMRILAEEVIINMFEDEKDWSKSAFDCLNHGVEIMTVDQLGSWAGVRAVIESYSSPAENNEKRGEG